MTSFATFPWTRLRCLSTGAMKRTYIPGLRTSGSAVPLTLTSVLGGMLKAQVSPAGVVTAIMPGFTPATVPVSWIGTSWIWDTAAARGLTPCP